LDGQGKREGDVDTLLTCIFGVLGLLTLDLLAIRFGVSSRDGRKESWW
jgi:hypothetical protein